MQIEFVTTDVFTDRQFGGNPLAVVANGTGLSTLQMQAIAAEFNLAETTFVLPPERPENTAKVRIFTPRAEVPFAGHPNIGTAFVLGQRGECHGRPIEGNILQFEEIAGLVGIEFMEGRIGSRRCPSGRTAAPDHHRRCRPRGRRQSLRDLGRRH